MVNKYENGWEPPEDRICEPERPEYEANQPKCKIAMPEEIFRLRDLSDAERRLLHLLEALCPAPRLRCYPTNDYLCWKLCLHERMLQYALGELKEKNYVALEFVDDPFAIRGKTRYIAVTGRHRSEYQDQRAADPKWAPGQDDDPFSF